MSKVHITLVGGQTAPVYNGIIATNPDKVIFICSTKTNEETEKIKKEISIPSEIELMDPVELNDIFQKTEKLLKTYSADNVSVNISGGTKPWAIVFNSVFSTHGNCQIIYIDQNNCVWDMTTRNATSLEFDMDKHFRLYGNPLENYRKFIDYNEDDLESVRKIENVRMSNFQIFNKLSTVLPNDWKHKLKQENFGKFDLPDNSYVEWEKPDFVRICLLNKKKEFVEAKIESPNAVNLVFNAGWFEYKVASLLSTWKYTKEIRMNCVFPFKNLPKNEADIIINTGSKILFVECKTQITTTTDIDKFRTVVKNYGGMGSKALFVTDAPMNDMAKTKCRESDIMTFSLQDNHLNLSTDKALQMLLDSELFNINTK